MEMVLKAGLQKHHPEVRWPNGLLGPIRQSAKRLAKMHGERRAMNGFWVIINIIKLYTFFNIPLFIAELIAPNSLNLTMVVWCRKATNFSNEIAVIVVVEMSCTPVRIVR